MALNAEEILNLDLIEGSNSDMLGPASYDLTIGKIIDPDGKERENFELEPQKMVIVVSAERMKMHDHVIGYATPVTTLHNSGVLSLATGIIDPAYQGLISSTLINFSKVPYTLEAGNRFLRVSFAEMKELQDKTTIEKIRREVNVSGEAYVTRRKDIAKTFPETFLNIPDIADKAAEARYQRLDKLIGKAAFKLALIPIGLAVVAFLGAPWVSELSSNAISDRAAAKLKAEGVDQIREDVYELKEQVNGPGE